MTFSKRLKIAMDEGGFTQGSLANAVNMAQSSVWKLISANASGSRRVVDIARVLNVRPEWLANGVGPMREGSSLFDEPCENKTAIIKYSGMFPVDIYPMDFKMHRGGKGVNPREHR
ncbi:helix-turn-helix domain-containing protein [Photorhabdus laumondii]|uniref:helix-turn-helix domain-containing protein n=1 Tax=Photorhabdus laumondii TaxID=2218628 RepID=UPI0033152FA1